MMKPVLFASGIVWELAGPVIFDRCAESGTLARPHCINVDFKTFLSYCGNGGGVSVSGFGGAGAVGGVSPGTLGF
jgi:hypothetical protein